MKTKVIEEIAPVRIVSKHRAATWEKPNSSVVLPPTTDTTAETTFGLVDEMVKRAIQDATQAGDLPLRWEALAWLWVCCPDIVDQLFLPWPSAVDVQLKAAAYLERYPTF